ncbi:hypothetical protein V8F20_001207 [Naviculisporaceae sp. PSN 640]
MMIGFSLRPRSLCSAVLFVAFSTFYGVCQCGSGVLVTSIGRWAFLVNMIDAFTFLPCCRRVAWLNVLNQLSHSAQKRDAKENESLTDIRALFSAAAPNP